MNIHKVVCAIAVAASLAGCMHGQYLHFNRDSLWNTSLADYSYCTYEASMLKKGLVFCHVDDHTTRERINNFVELEVRDVLADNLYVLRIPVLHCGDPEGSRPLKPVVVRTLDGSPKYKVGDTFTNWGQYRLIGNADRMVKSFYRPVLYLSQINTNNTHVFVEPFIDYGQCDR